MRIELIKGSIRPQHRRRETLVVNSAINPSARPPPRPPSSSSSARSPASPPPPPLPGSAPLGFSAPDASSFRLAVLGDLHYDPRDVAAFTKAQEQLARVLREKAEEEGAGSEAKAVSRLVQLGDLGASSFSPGTLRCFEHAREFLGAAAVEAESFGAPPALVAGNHGEFLRVFFFAFLPYLLFPSLSFLLSLSLSLAHFFSPKIS